MKERESFPEHVWGGNWRFASWFAARDGQGGRAAGRPRAQLSHPQGPARAWSRRSRPSCWCPPWPGSPRGSSGASGKGLSLLPLSRACISGYQGKRQAPQAPAGGSDPFCPLYRMGNRGPKWSSDSFVGPTEGEDRSRCRPASLPRRVRLAVDASAPGLRAGGGSESCPQSPRLVPPRLGLGEP